MAGKKADQLATLYLKMQCMMRVLEENDSLSGDYRHPVFASGDPDSKILLLGEAPGADEVTAGEPFVGKAGILLNALFAEAGISRAQVYISNVVKYRPVVRSERSLRNRTPSRNEILYWLPVIKQEIALICPQVIVTLGNIPLQTILMLSGSSKETIGNCHGFSRTVFIDEHAYTLFPLYHPASSIYNRSLIDVMREDTCLLGEHLVKELEQK